MAQIIGGLTTSHVPMIGRAIASNTQQEVPFAPFFDAFKPVHAWMDEAKPDVVIVIYNDHGLNFFLDNMPTFAVGAANEYPNADEGWGAPPPRAFRGAPRLSWHIIKSLIEDEFDVSSCQQMKFDHAGITALDLAWEGHGEKPVAVIPIVVNAVLPPLPTPKRCHAFGQAIGRAVRSFPADQKVFVIGSGGLSHQLGVMGKINQSFDRLCMEKMVDDPLALTRYTNDEVVDLAGSQGLELMTWLVMRGALTDDARLVSSLYFAPISHTGGAMMLFDSRAPADATA
jgi:protocatechuate 4,5-dioxygenase beta chain